MNEWFNQNPLKTEIRQTKFNIISHLSINLLAPIIKPLEYKQNADL
jgi:hypothetical protein